MYMADEMIDIDLPEEGDGTDINNSVQKRIKTLSEKVRLTSEERDELAKAKETLETEKAAALKERDFYANFADMTGKYQGASEHKDAIKEKVMKGYSVEDATVAVLAQEGKLGGSVSTTPASKPESAAGGSSVNTPMSSEEKPINEMTRDEKLAKLKQYEAEGIIGID